MSLFVELTLQVREPHARHLCNRSISTVSGRKENQRGSGAQKDLQDARGVLGGAS